MKLTEQDLIRIVEQYRQEAEEGRRERIEYNKRNFDVYHMRQNYSHKIGGQSTEFIAKQQQAVDQLVAFILQGIYESNDWYSIEAAPGIPAERLFIQPNEAKAILDRQLKNTKINEVISDLIQLGLLGSLMVAKVRGHYVDKPNYTTNIVYNKETASSDTVLIKQSQKKWQLKVDTIRQEQFYPDPTGRWLFIVEELEMDYHELLTMAEEGMFKKSDVLKLKGKALKSVGDSDFEHSRETGQNYTTPSDQHRHKIRLYELWGKVVKEGELVHDNIHAIIADDICVLSGPNPNPNWHGGHPYIVSPILRVANSVWHRALMDAASSHNITMNELYNLIIDGAMMSVHGIKQLRDDYVKDSQELSGGIPPGTTLSVTRDLPHNAKVIENVVTSTIPPEAMQVFGMIQNEHNQSSLTNDLRLGSSPQSDLRATAIVEASQSIQGVIGSFTRRIEESLITPLLENHSTPSCRT
ncbi:MAG: hypothetical protein HC842_02240 [Cytophagales bacterium]|nr:hypothetical protein [Cytophagales bacterium]